MKIDITKYNWNDIQKVYDTGLTTVELCKKYGFNKGTLLKANKLGFFKSRTTSEALKKSHSLGKINNKAIWTPERRKEQSERKIKLYKENPDKHPNRKLSNNNNKLTYQEKLAYTFFTDNNIKFYMQFYVKEFSYWIDFLLNDNVAVESDGEK